MAAMADETAESRNQARLKILELANMLSVPMSLNAAVRLRVPDAIWAGGSNAPLTAAEILAEIRPSTAGGDAENLQRILRMLASYGVFEEHVVVSGERKYSLTDVGKTLVADADGLSYADYVLQHHQVYSQHPPLKNLRFHFSFSNFSPKKKRSRDSKWYSTEAVQLLRGL